MIVEPDLKYCPRCKDEYRADIELCADCGVALLTGTELLAAENKMNERKNSRKGELTAADDVVTIHKADLNELKAIEKELQAENIGVLISKEGGGCGSGCCGPSCVLQVRREEAQEAFTIIQDYIGRTTAISHHDLSTCDKVFDPQAGEAVCPACGFKFQTSTTTCPDCGLCLG